MKLLFDANLSHRLVQALASEFPESTHVRDCGLLSEDDATLWEFAKERGFVIVSKDEDFHQRSFVFGPPPKVVWVRLGNCTTDDVLQRLLAYRNDLIAFERDAEAAFLILS